MWAIGGVILMTIGMTIGIYILQGKPKQTVTPAVDQHAAKIIDTDITENQKIYESYPAGSFVRFNLAGQNALRAARGGKCDQARQILQRESTNLEPDAQPLQVTFEHELTRLCTT